MKIFAEIFKGNKNNGVAVLFAILMLGIILGITLALSAIFIPKIPLSFDTKNSPAAIHAADTGLEWCLYNLRKSAFLNPPIFLNGARFSINRKFPPVPSDCVSPINSLGRFQGSLRSLEADI